MTVAARLAHHGFQVDLFEQRGIPGGKAGNLEMDGFRFDTGPSVLTMPFVLDEFFDEIGENREDYIEFKSLPLSCRYFYRDGTQLNAYADPGEMALEIEKKTQDQSADLHSYINYTRKIYELAAPVFLFRDFRSLSGLFQKDFLKIGFKLHRLDPLRSVHRANRSYFSDPKNIQLFDRYATYNGSNPYRAPATLNIIPYVEHALGSYSVKGGIFALSRGIEKAAKKKGVNFFYRTPVEKILTHRGRVKGIAAGGEEKEYDVVISNRDVISTYRDLLNQKNSRIEKRYSRLGLSSSTLVFYWGVKGDYPGLDVNNIFFSEDYREEFRDIFHHEREPADPTVYIHISSKINSGDAPKGHENWFVMVNMPPGEGRESIESMREKVFKRLEENGIHARGRIVAEDVLTPELIEQRTGSFRGSLYGVSSNSRTSAFLRHSNRSAKWKGLYFCGGSVHPGGGMPLVLLSGKITAEMVLKRNS
jgi:phytoene desaturase